MLWEIKQPLAAQARCGEEPGKGGILEVTGVEGGEKNGLVLHDTPVLVV